MAGITLADAEAKLATWLAAEEKIANGQEYTIGSRTLKRADLADVRESITYWDGKVKQLSRGSTGIRIRGATPT